MCEESPRERIGRPRRSRRIYEGRVVSLRVDEVESGDGRSRPYEVVEHPGAVCVVAQPEPGRIVMVRQYRPAIDRYLWEVPAGKLDPGETAVDCAVRELREETGYRCERMRELWSFFTSPGFCDERLHLCVAEGVVPGPPEPEPYEEIRVEVMPVDEAWAMVTRDEIPDAKTQIALAWTRARRRS
ncbi:MAG TPA: NUDIX hydrolase [Candidatus Dormibacteraeota bacterium]|nr:NUDIX hydrolase [Candidatus Dormibacteraeota bacterium]